MLKSSRRLLAMLERRPYSPRHAPSRSATVDDILLAMNQRTSPAVPAFLAPNYADGRVLRLSPNARAPEVLNAELDRLRWHEDPAKVLGKENRSEVYLARLVATTIWRNRSMPTHQKRIVVQGVIDALHASIQAQNAPPEAEVAPIPPPLVVAAPSKAKPAAAKPAAAKPAAAKPGATKPGAAAAAATTTTPSTPAAAKSAPPKSAGKTKK